VETQPVESLLLFYTAPEGQRNRKQHIPAAKEPEPKVPTDLSKALAADRGPAGDRAREAWSDITPAARRDFIHWITSAKQPETRARRTAAACDMLAQGKRRPCCFDRSGMYGNSLACPVAEA
jgi:uncharacterized protein YdeI (YjbR/CyaY-like superfamily)